MKVLVAIVVLALAVGAKTSKLSFIKEKLIPSFTSGHVIKGQDAEPHSAPFIVSVGNKGPTHTHMCGGAILNSQWFLTAAHCLQTPTNVTGIKIAAGAHDIKNPGPTWQYRVVDYGTMHKSYGGNVGPYDIALLHVSEPFIFNEWVQKIDLPDNCGIHFGEGQLHGWGQSKALSFSVSPILQVVTADLLSYEECKVQMPADSPLDPKNVCSSSRGEGISACNGDSGGPLSKTLSDGSRVLVGLVSWGYIPCGWANYPSVYTAVCAYHDWINTIINAYNILY